MKTGMDIRRLLPWRVAHGLAQLRLKLSRAFWDRAIVRTRPLPAGGDGRFEVHSLLGSKHVGMCLWAVKSLLHYAGRAYQVVLHDDGTLSARDIATLEAHLPGVRIIRRRSADEAIKPCLARHPHVAAYRDGSLGRTPWGRRMSVFSLKILDFNLLSDACRILALDTDVLFFRRPDEIIDWMERDEDSGSLYCFEDYRPLFVADHLLAGFEKKREPRCYFNSGLICFDKRGLDLDLLERWIQDHADDVDTAYTFEQRAWNHLIHATVSHAPLPETYSFNYTGSECVATHFGMKQLFFDNLPRIYAALRH